LSFWVEGEVTGGGRKKKKRLRVKLRGLGLVGWADLKGLGQKIMKK
jgi:hypothetical protein